LAIRDARNLVKLLQQVARDYRLHRVEARVVREHGALVAVHQTRGAQQTQLVGEASDR